MKLIINWLAAAVAVIVGAYLLPGVSVAGIGTALLVALVLGLVNALVRPVLVFLTLPLSILTFGLFLFVVNALMILLVDALVPGFQVDGFWWALLFSLIVSIVAALLHRAR